MPLVYGARILPRTSPIFNKQSFCETEPRLIFTVAIPCPLRRTFDYLPPMAMDDRLSIVPGIRVKVPFGGKTVIGLVTEVKDSSEHPGGKLKAIAEVIDREPLVDTRLLELYLWAADYYQHPAGDALLSIFPTLLRKGETIPDNLREFWQLTTHGLGLGDNSLARARKQQQLVQLLRENGPLAVEQIAGAGFSPSILRSLKARGLVAAVRQPAALGQNSHPITDAEPPLPLRPDQQKALASLHLDRFESYLLFGDTGTGKTEVYLQAIARVLALGKQALVLVPEISLTPQTLARFRRRFPCEIAVMHSGLTDRERLQSWADARCGKAPIVIGTRSAIFTPLANPGIIILDEEHDPSFKQQEGFRYSARDVAVMRAHRENIPVILGSATPSLESIANCERGRYRRLELTDRGGKAPPPRWQLIDLRGTSLKAGFSAGLLARIRAELDSGNQVLVFLNRRGYSPLLLCHDCGWQAECQRCSAKMTAHLGQQRLVCHHCEAQQTIPQACRDCQSPNIQFVGQGTERSEEILREFFPGTRILRLDRDSTRRKNAMAEAITEIQRNEPCILIGTQMIAKGHHFPGVTMAALLEVDSGLFSTDFRATERMAQMITQVAGRAGRGEQPGTVIIQSHYVDHPLLAELVQNDYRNFSRLLLAQRQLQQMPPYTNMAVIRAEADNPEKAEAFLHRARTLLERALPPSPDCRYLGPLPAALERRNGFYRFTLSVSAANRLQLGEALRNICPRLESEKSGRALRWSVDVDPQDTT